MLPKRNESHGKKILQWGSGGGVANSDWSETLNIDPATDADGAGKALPTQHQQAKGK